MSGRCNSIEGLINQNLCIHFEGPLSIWLHPCARQRDGNLNTESEMRQKISENKDRIVKFVNFLKILSYT